MIRLTTLAAIVIISASPLAAEEFDASPIGALIIQDESGGENVPNFRYDATHTAGGICQMTDTNWKRIAPTIDIDIVKLPNAGSASRFDQNRACWKLLATDGVGAWTCCNKKLREHLSQQPAFVKVRRAHEKPATSAGESPPPVKAEAPHNWNVFAADESDSGGQSFLITGEHQ